MTRRLPHDQEERLVAILRRAAGKPFNEQQARLDFAGILARLPRQVEDAKRRKGRGRKQSAISVLAEIAADTYFAHTGKGPGNAANNDHQWKGGRYPAFVIALADVARIEYDRTKVPEICREVRRQLSKRAKLPPPLSNDPRISGDARATSRGKLLEPHSEETDEDGFPIVKGYEPARDPELNPAAVFGHLLKQH